MTRQEQIKNTLVNFYNQPVAKVSAELLLSIGAVLFFAVFAIRPTLLTISDLIKEIEDKERLDQQLTQKIAALTTAQSTYLSLQDRLIVLDEAIPNSPEFVEALKVIERVASDQQLVINNIIVAEVPDETEALVEDRTTERKTIPLSVGMTGDYASIRIFIEDLLRVRRSFVVDSITITKNDERGNESLQAVVTLGLPYFGSKEN